MRYWIETNKHGQRVWSQTTNPKRGDVWNKPKASTYTNIRVLFLDENEHVANDGLSFYAGPEEIDAFAAKYSEALTDDRNQRELTVLRVLAARAAKMRFTVTAGPVASVIE